MVVAEVCSSMKYPKRCQYKHAKQKKYHVRNWAEYNEGLRRRGDLTVWFDEEAIANWKADKTGKPGGQRVYSDMAIETGRCPEYKLAYRQTEGFLHSIASLLGLGIEIPDTRRCVGARGCSARSCGFRKPRVLPPLSVGEMTLRLYAALNYSQNSARTFAAR